MIGAIVELSGEVSTTLWSISERMSHKVVFYLDHSQ